MRHAASTHVADGGEGLAIGAGLELGGSRASAKAAATSAHHLDGLDGDWLWVFKLYPSEACLIVAREHHSIGKAAVGELLQGETTSAGGDLSGHLCGRLSARGLLHGYHSDVFVILIVCASSTTASRSAIEEGTSGMGRLWECLIYSSRGVGLAPDQLLHSVFLTHPRATCRAPAWGRSYGELQT